MARKCDYCNENPATLLINRMCCGFANAYMCEPYEYAEDKDGKGYRTDKLKEGYVACPDNGGYCTKPISDKCRSIFKEKRGYEYVKE